MDITEALKALKEGKRVGRKGWIAKTPYQFKDGVLTSGGEQCAFITLDDLDLQADDWEVFDDGNLLNQKEKECLENLLSLYLDNGDFVFAKELMHEQYFLKIFIFPWDTDKKAEHIYLPLSTTSGNMFSKLEEHHLYTADDLGLFRE